MAKMFKFITEKVHVTERKTLLSQVQHNIRPKKINPVSTSSLEIGFDSFYLNEHPINEFHTLLRAFSNR